MSKKDEDKAARYNVGKIDPTFVDPVFIMEVARVMQINSAKYERDNWRKGMPHLQPLACGYRHLLKIIANEDVDPEDGCLHAAKVAVNMMFYIMNYYQNPDLDDRTQMPIQSIDSIPGIDLDKMEELRKRFKG